MTIEIRQMVIKSRIDRGETSADDKPAPAGDDCQDEDGDGEGSLGGSEELRRLRALFAFERERVRER